MYGVIRKSWHSLSCSISLRPSSRSSLQWACNLSETANSKYIMCIKYSNRVSTCSKYLSLRMVQKMRNLITHFKALVPFGLDCRLQNPAYIGHCPVVGSSHGIISWWVACSRRSDERMNAGCEWRPEKRITINGIERKIILWIARWRDRGVVERGGELITSWISPGGGGDTSL